MKDLIKYIEISNFKSIKHLKLDDCKRINLFIGYPNVGKSNIIEALSLFTVPCLEENDSLKQLIRFENKYELLNDSSNFYCEVETNIESIQLTVKQNPEILLTDNSNNRWYYYFTPNFDFLNTDIKSNITDISNIENNDYGGILRYIFNTEKQGKSLLSKSFDSNVFYPPYGENLIDVLTNNTKIVDVKSWIKQEFKKFGLEYVIDKASNSLKVQRRLNDGEVLQLPYSSIADTLQRIIFYKTAIASNTDSVLLFEEPEAHAFPPYIRTLTNDIADSKSNQFFIATHSPIIVNEFIEDAEICKELAIYIIDFKNNETIIKRLTADDLTEIFDNGVDLFFNLEKYLD
jgi:AAA15 family ATPase/GTPase